MKFHYDLHVHSVLSPCADVLMTPNNLCNMVSLKGLDVFAVTDHNSAKQLPVIAEIAQSYSFLVVPGIEVCVKEGIHVLVYFRTVEDALRFDGILETYIDQSTKGDTRTGTARLADREDFIIGELPYFPSAPLALSLRGLSSLLKTWDHLLYFAHLDRPVTGGISLAREIPADGIELTPFAPADFLPKNGLSDFRVLRNSDAHQLMDIAEKRDDNVLELPNLGIDALFGVLKR